MIAVHGQIVFGIYRSVSVYWFNWNNHLVYFDINSYDLRT